LLRRPSDSLNIKNVTILKLRVLNIKKNIKAGVLSNSYVLINKVNKAAWEILCIPYPLCLTKQRGQVKQKEFP